jgi:hypothetical protein
MQPVFELDQLHRIWVHIPELSDFHLEFDISAKKGFKRTEIAIRQDPVFDLTKITDLIWNGLALDSYGFAGFNKEAFEVENNPNLFAVHFDLPGKYFLESDFKSFRKCRDSD